MTFAGVSSALYYRHSGRISASGAALALGGGCLAGIVLGTAYAYLDLYIPVAGYVTIVLTGGTGFLEGLAVSRLLKAGKIRNVGLGLLIALLAAGVMFLASWEMWLYALLQRGQAGVALWDLVSNPSAAWQLVLLVNAKGAWTLQGDTPTGLALGGLWLVEAGILMVIPLVMARTAILAAPFCESCNKWCGTRPLIQLNTGDFAALRPRLEARDFTALASLGKAPAGANRFWLLYLQGCGDCDTTQTLCIDEMTFTRDKNGKLRQQKKALLKRLVLTPEDTVAVATTVAELSKPPVAPAETESAPSTEAPSPPPASS